MPPRHQKIASEAPAFVRDHVVEGLLDAWYHGFRFTIEMDDRGVVTVRKGLTVIHRYDDAGIAIRNLFPDKAGMT